MHITKRLGALAMAVVMTCALAITAGAIDTTKSYTVSFSGMPEDHMDALIQDVEITANTVKVTFETDAKIGTLTGNVTDVEKGDSFPSDYTMSYVDNVLTVTCPSTTAAGDFSAPLKVTVEISAGGVHRGGSTVDTTLTLVQTNS